jgi:hypothetical protein
MEIKIINKDCNDLLNKNKIRWTLFSRKNIFHFIIYAIVGLILLIGSAVTEKDISNFWGMGSSLGLSLIFLSLFYFSHTYQNKRKFITRTRAYIKLFNEQKQETELVFADEKITYKDFQSYSEWKWTKFSHYMLYKDYLFLILDNSFLNALIVHKSEVTPEKFDELLSFSKGHLRLRK